MKERVIAAVKKMKRDQWIVCGLAGLLLLVIAMPVKKTEPEEVSVEETVQKDQEPDIRQEYEKQLELALSQVQGIGKVKVSVTMESTGKKIVEKDIPEDSEISSQKDGQGMEHQNQTASTQETTVYEETEGGSQIPYVASEIYPEIRGVLVVAQGGDDPALVQQIQEAAMALFHVEAHKIKVLKMK